MKTTHFILLALLTLGLMSCNESTSLLDSNDQEDMVLKSAEIAVNDLLTEGVYEEACYEAEFFASSERLLRQLARYNKGNHLLHGKQIARYNEQLMPDVSIDTAATGYPIVITIDYGDSTTLHNGRIISGVVSIELSAPRSTNGATRLVTYTACVIDSVAIDGTTRQVFNGDNENSRTMSSESDITFVLPDGTIMHRSGIQLRNWLEGINTPMEHADDLIEITGSVQMQVEGGSTWLKVIKEPLLRTGECRYYVQGLVSFSENDTVLATLNFGDGSCDNIATLTSNGETIEIELQGRHPEARLDEYKEKQRSKGK
ncbi:hypothetical protein [Roseimarinus sediminis]|uniref:hypothetical protein n=1 Tax=Roseimarinus sediminis TaxID=1610899 RepID=UPI003D254AE1